MHLFVAVGIVVGRVVFGSFGHVFNCVDDERRRLELDHPGLGRRFHCLHFRVRIPREYVSGAACSSCGVLTKFTLRDRMTFFSLTDQIL